MTALHRSTDGVECTKTIIYRSGEKLSTAETLWAAVADQLRSQLNDAVWLSTFAGVNMIATHSSTGATHIQLEVPSEIARDRINSRYHALVQDAFNEVCGPATEFDVVVLVSEADATSMEPFPTPDFTAPSMPGTRSTETAARFHREQSLHL